jgi:hypothetical protein
VSGGRHDVALAPRQIVECFVNWLYDECPSWPEEVPRERLLALWAATHDAPWPRATMETGD